MSPRSIMTRRFMPHLIGGLLVSLAVVTWITPPKAVVLHNILHHLNILPLMMSGLIFGWRGSLRALALSTALCVPIIYRHWEHERLDAQDQIVELSTFGAAGLIAGAIADRERTQRRRVEMTKLELEHVHSELQANIQHLKKTERLTAAGELSASLAHEIRNPLASISGAAGILARGNAPAESREECLDILMKESQRLNKLLTHFLDFARPRLPRFQKTELTSLVQSVAALAQHVAMRQNVELVLETAAGLPEIECDGEQVKQVLINLVLNAVQATERPGAIIIRTHTSVDTLCIEVVDHGVGIPAADLERVFDPFFTTKESGTGLGLAVAANIVAQHGGAINCRRNNAAAGMTFRLELPLRRAAAVRTQAWDKVAV